MAFKMAIKGVSFFAINFWYNSYLNPFEMLNEAVFLFSHIKCDIKH